MKHVFFHFVVYLFLRYYLSGIFSWHNFWIVWAHDCPNLSGDKREKTDWNCWLRRFAFSTLSPCSVLFSLSFNVDMPRESCLLFLISENSCLFVCLFVFWFVLFFVFGFVLFLFVFFFFWGGGVCCFVFFYFCLFVFCCCCFFVVVFFLFVFCLFLAHLSWRLKVILCDHSTSVVVVVVVRMSVRPSTIFKQHLLLNHWLDFDQTSQEWSLVVPLSKLFKWFWSIAYLGHRS